MYKVCHREFLFQRSSFAMSVSDILCRTFQLNFKVKAELYMTAVTADISVPHFLGVVMGVRDRQRKNN